MLVTYPAFWQFTHYDKSWFWLCPTKKHSLSATSVITDIIIAVEKGELQKGQLPCNKTWTGWKSGQKRSLWSTTSIRSCIWEDIIQQCSKAGTYAWGGRSSVERDQEPLADTSSIWVNRVLLQLRKPTGSWVASKSTSIAEIKKSLHHSAQCLPDHTWNLIFVLSIQKKVWTGWRESREEPKWWSKDWKVCHVSKGWENCFVQPSENKT